MDRKDRLEVQARVKAAATLDEEQAALAQAVAVVDIRESLPPGVADLYHQWDTRRYPDVTSDYVKVVRQHGAAYDRGAQRYCIPVAKVQAVQAALEQEGFIVALGMSLAAKA